MSAASHFGKTGVVTRPERGSLIAPLPQGIKLHKSNAGYCLAVTPEAREVLGIQATPPYFFIVSPMMLYDACRTLGISLGALLEADEPGTIDMIRGLRISTGGYHESRDKLCWIRFWHLRREHAVPCALLLKLIRQCENWMRSECVDINSRYDDPKLSAPVAA